MPRRREPYLFINSQGFRSQREAAAALGVHVNTIQRLVARQGYTIFVHTFRKNGPPRPCTFDGITYPSMNAAAKALGVTPTKVKRWLDEA